MDQVNTMNLLKANFFLFFLVPVLILFAATGNCLAESTIKCHCFTDRSYNPADRFAADEYILVTSFNSLLSKFYDIPKRQIVMIKMNEGMPQDDLLISLRIARITGIDLRKFLSLHRENKTWEAIITDLSQNEAIKKDEILEAARSGLPAEEAGIMIADEIIAGFFQVKPEKVQALRKSGLSEKEMTLLFILAHVSEVPPEALLEQYKKQGRSWSEIAFNLGFEPKTAGKLILAYPAKQIPK
jgi:hypothetical protein